MKSTNKRERERDGFYLFKALLIVFVLALLSACSPKYIFIPGNIINPHTHTYSDEWAYDKIGHWHNATCGHDVEKDYAQHTFGERIDATTGTAMTYKYCTVCGYINEESKEEYSGKVATLDNGTTSTEYNTIKAAISAWNEETDGDYTLIIKDGEYREFDIVINQAEAKNLTIKAETPHGVTMYDAGEAGEINHIFYVSGEGGWNNQDKLTIDGIDFHIETTGLIGKDGDTATNNYSIAIRLGKNTSGDGNWYAHNVTVQNCSFYGESEISYPVYSGSNSQPQNITITDCYAEKVKTVYGGYGTNLVLRNSVFTDVMSILNSQAAITTPSEGYNTTIDNIKATVNWSKQKDDMYGIRSSGGNVLIKDSTIIMENNTTNYTGLVVLRTNAQKVDVINSHLEVIDHGDTVGKGYVFYNATDGVDMDVTIDASSVVEGTYIANFDIK